jgi:hypothetical protein
MQSAKSWERKREGEDEVRDDVAGDGLDAGGESENAGGSDGSDRKDFSDTRLGEEDVLEFVAEFLVGVGAHRDADFVGEAGTVFGVHEEIALGGDDAVAQRLAQGVVVGEENEAAVGDEEVAGFVESDCRAKEIPHERTPEKSDVR